MKRFVMIVALAALLFGALSVAPRPAQAGWPGGFNNQPRYGYWRESHIPAPYTLPWYTAPVFDYPPPFIYPYYMYPPYAFHVWPPGSAAAPAGYPGGYVVGP